MGEPELVQVVRLGICKGGGIKGGFCSGVEVVVQMNPVHLVLLYDFRHPVGDQLPYFRISRIQPPVIADLAEIGAVFLAVAVPLSDLVMVREGTHAGIILQPQGIDPAVDRQVQPVCLLQQNGKRVEISHCCRWGE